MTRDDLLPMTGRQLLEVMRGGHPIDPRALDDTEYDGTSLGLYDWVERRIWKKFAKVFHRAPTGRLVGWNCSVDQTPLDRPWELTLRAGEPICYGWYEVVPMEGHRVPGRLPSGLLIHYGRGGNRLLDPLNRVRDPLVALERDSADRLLGWSYVDLGPLRVPTPSFFLLERGRPLSHHAPPPRAP